MRRLMLTVMTGALLAVAPMARAQDQSGPSTGAQQGDVILTNGEGLVLAAPDRAFVSIAAETRSKQPKEAQRLNAEAMAAVQQKLKAAGIAAEAIRTTSLDLQPEFDYHEGRQTLRGYVARNTIEVRVDAIDKVGEIVDASVGSGATSVSGIRFDLKNREATERKALGQAVADARGRAEALAQAAGRAIERIVRIEDHSAGDQPPMPRPMFRQAAMAADQASTPVAPGQLEIRARVALTVRVK